MELAKQEQISTLYALRAGLSVMSEISDRAKKVESNIENEKQNIRNNEREIESKNCELQSLERKKTEYEEENTNKIEKLKNDKKDAELKKPYKKATIILLIISVIVFLSMPALLYFCVKNGTELIGLVGPLTLVSFLTMIYNSIKLSHQKADKIRENEKLRNQISSLENPERNNPINRWFLNRPVAIKNEIGELESKIEKSKKICVEYKNKVDEEKANFDAVYKTVKEQFNSVLDERDWGIVDYVIYNFETGRALDLRDALMQADLERRNDQLLDAIAYATNVISRSIQSGFGEMKQMVENKFNMLNNNIVSALNDVNASIKDLSEQNKTISGKLSDIANISSAQEALQRKISTSSDTMAGDVRYMRELANREYYGF